jgi:hypothetical protein
VPSILHNCSSDPVRRAPGRMIISPAESEKCIELRSSKDNTPFNQVQLSDNFFDFTKLEEGVGPQSPTLTSWQIVLIGLGVFVACILLLCVFIRAMKRRKRRKNSVNFVINPKIVNR